MSLISGFVHYNIFRNMCDSKINEPNNKQIIATKIEQKPDIEMGIKDNSLIQVKNVSKCPVKSGNPPDYWWV